jgi:signal transduction histidine kinase
MRQVFINLINNAIEAMNNAGTLQVETCYNNSTIEVYVRDTGSGIKEEDREKIFEPLFTTKARGTGLGLAISNNIVEKHGGSIIVTSQQGKGTCFTVKLPLVPPNDKEE